MPTSASDIYTLIKHLGNGKDGEIFLAIPKHITSPPSAPRALKIANLGWCISCRQQFFNNNIRSSQILPGWPLPNIYDRAEDDS
jgi:hypothetical protein